MDKVMEMKRNNEEIAEKFSEMERRLSSATSPADLFERWAVGMADAFGIPFLWISLIACPENVPLIDALRGSVVLKDRVSIIDEATFTDLALKGDTPVLVNEALRPFFRLLPQNKYFIKSMAVAPITSNGRIIGSLNHGDPSPKRYDPDMDTSLLKSLAAKISTCLAVAAPPLENDIDVSQPST
ncbi:MAG: hypothetical protein CSYNP_03629 [Syntrophus sp. SKADARSKE-3]|nr:hypothetical protein [Syntrophus sp. SKADARSKE-3]